MSALRKCQQTNIDSEAADEGKVGIIGSTSVYIVVACQGPAAVALFLKNRRSIIIL